MLVAIILFVVLGSLVALGYVLNKKTPVPEGCEKLDNCEGCRIISCVNHPSKGGNK